MAAPTPTATRPRHRAGPAAAGPRTAAHRGLGRKTGPDVRADLEGVRALAVVGVVVYHLRASWLPGGFAGVDVFFVLSGYFITGLLLRELERTGSVDLLRFWGRRARRLLPASVLVVVTTVAAAYALTNPLAAHQVARDGVVASVFGVNWLQAVESTDYLRDTDPSPLLHYWSLGVEEQFYVGWPLIVLACAFLARVLRRRSVRPTLAVVAVVGCAASFWLALGQTTPANSFAYFGTPERAWQLAVGGLLAAAAGLLERVPRGLRDTGRWVGVALLLAFYVGASTSIVYPGRKALVPVAGAVLIVAAGGRERRRDPVARALCSWPAQLGGRYSYGWYLWHYPPLVLLPMALGHPLGVGALAACGVGTLALAVATYHLLENPVRSSTRLARRRGRSLVLGGGLVAVAVATTAGLQAASSYSAEHTRVSTHGGAVLDPQPAAAARELPTPWRNGCMRRLADPGTARECWIRPDTGHGDVVVVGDSHAGTWWSATLAIATRHDWGYRFWGRESCPLADVTKYANGGPYTACDRWRADVVRRLVADRPSLVITASFDSILPRLLPRDADGTPLRTRADAARSRELYEQGLERSLRTLRAAGIPVLVVGDNPGYPDDQRAPECVLAHPGDVGACSAPQSVALPPGPDDLQAAARVGVSSISFTPVFCSAGRCHQVVGHTLAYRDNNHLTAEMTARLEPALDRAAVAARSHVVHVTVRSVG